MPRSRPKPPTVKFPERVVHILHEGVALCGAGLPITWPSAHRWVRLAEYPSEVGKQSFCHGCVEQYVERTIPIEAQEDPHPPFEECCFCFTPTPLWTVLPDRKPGEQVACCLACAQTRRREDVPSKPDWCKAAEARRPAFYRRW